MTILDLLGRYGRRRHAITHAAWDGPSHTPLERLPLLAIDCETTGLDPRRDRIVSFAAVRIEAGLRVADQPALDLLIDPQAEIPARATAIHGIDRTDVAGAPPFATAFADIAASLSGAVLVGHFIGFDLAVLRREAARAGKSWREPPSLDTANLAAALGQQSHNVDLDVLLGRLGIDAKGRRHTAAGDARRAADLFVALAHRLIGQGRGTYGAAVAAQRTALR